MSNYYRPTKKLGFLIAAGLIFAWATSYFIHSSELWSIYVSKKFFNPEFSTTIFIKPLFHLVLYFFHALPLTDVQHLLAVKFFFAALGALQIYLIFKLSTLQKLNRIQSFQFIFLFVTLISSRLYLENFFRIRTDQICLTLFLLFLFLNAKYELSLKVKILFAALYPMIGIKGLLFSVLHIIHLMPSLKKSPLKSRHLLIYTLTLVSLIIWLINFGWTGVTYFINSTAHFRESIPVFKNWLVIDFLIIGISIASLFSRNYRSYIQQNLKTNLSVLSLSALVIICCIPQKHTYFIASYIPIFVINAMTFIQWFVQSKLLIKNVKSIYIIILLIIFSFKIADFARNSPYRSNFDQLVFINYVSRLTKLNNLTYLDGFGSIPRGNNLNCFTSPDDEITNTSCRNLIQQSVPDMIILTTRFVSYLGHIDELTNQYKDIGFNIYIKKDLEHPIERPKNLMPAMLVFGFER